jgi:hypothetical protein
MMTWPEVGNGRVVAFRARIDEDESGRNAERVVHFIYEKAVSGAPRILQAHDHPRVLWAAREMSS